VETLFAAADAIRKARRLLVVTGAGMSAESGIPTYRDKQGLWTRLEPFASRGIEPAKVAHQDGYERDASQAWGVHEWLRRTMAAAPLHRGYGVVTRLLARAPEAFLLTPNVDELHRRAGVPSVAMWERYGSLFQLQCVRGCRKGTWRDDRAETTTLDPETLRATPPGCPFCAGPSRPAVQLDNDELFEQDAVGGERYQRFVATPVDVCLVIGTTLWLTWPDRAPTVITVNLDPVTHDNYAAPLALTMGAEHALVGLEWAIAELSRG